jgi:hypothetical protein
VQRAYASLTAKSNRVNIDLHPIHFGVIVKTGGHIPRRLEADHPNVRAQDFQSNGVKTEVRASQGRS